MYNLQNNEMARRFTAESLSLLQSLSLDCGSDEEAASNQNIHFEYVENDSFENMLDICKSEPDTEITRK